MNDDLAPELKKALVELTKSVHFNTLIDYVALRRANILDESIAGETEIFQFHKGRAYEASTLIADLQGLVPAPPPVEGAEDNQEGVVDDRVSSRLVEVAEKSREHTISRSKDTGKKK